MKASDIYYCLKPMMPRSLQLALRRRIVALQRWRYSEVWPIDPQSGVPPPGWPGWPDGKRFALVLTHDVESTRGVERCAALMDLEEQAGFRSSFNFVAELYPLPAGVREGVAARGFEVGLHGLKHDNRMYASRAIFLAEAARINAYLRDWKAVGFRSPAMHHNLEWARDLQVLYDSSTFDVDPFEPQPDGMGTIFPFVVAGDEARPGYVELPYTLPQDHTLFVLMREKDIGIWKKKLDWIAQRGGMALLITHPDYMNWGAGRAEVDEFPVAFYREFLEHVKAKYAGSYWQALPREAAAFARQHAPLRRVGSARTVPGAAAPRAMEPPRFTYKGVRLDNVNYGDIRAIVARGIAGRGYCCLTDVGNVSVAIGDADLRTAINNSLISICDGTPLAWFGWTIGCRRVERISGAEFMSRMLREQNGFRHYLLGDTEDTQARIVGWAKGENPSVRIEGHSPPFKEFTDADNEEIAARIRAAAPDIVWVSFGGVRQEKWAYNNIDRLDRGLMMCVGAAFRYLVGDIKAPPLFVQKMGLQWLSRTLQTPSPWAAWQKRQRRYRRFLRYLPGEVARGRRAVREYREMHER